MMTKNDTDLILAGEPLQPLNSAVIGGIGLFVSASGRPDLGESINPNQPRLGVCLDPFLKIIESALVDALPFGMQFQALGPSLHLHKPVHALLESALTVFERKVKCIAHNWLGFAEHEAPRRYGNANI